MTTGRINQVTTLSASKTASPRFIATDGRSSPLSRWELCHFVFNPLVVGRVHLRCKAFRRFSLLRATRGLIDPGNKDFPCFPFSHISESVTPSPYKRDGESLPSVKTTDDRQNLKGFATLVAYLRVDNCIRFGHRQAIHTLRHRRPTLQKRTRPDLWRSVRFVKPLQFPCDLRSFKTSQPFRRAKSLTRFEGRLPSNTSTPLSKGYPRGVLVPVKPTFQPPFLKFWGFTF
jgi:hypothetical protein